MCGEEGKAAHPIYLFFLSLHGRCCFSTHAASSAQTFFFFFFLRNKAQTPGWPLPRAAIHLPKRRWRFGLKFPSSETWADSRAANLRRRLRMMPEGRTEHNPDDRAAAGLRKPGSAEPDLACTRSLAPPLSPPTPSGAAAQLQIPLFKKIFLSALYLFFCFASPSSKNFAFPVAAWFVFCCNQRQVEGVLQNQR